ncbi:MAG: deoxyribonuclease IV [Verrucomicrobiota bacterium]|nr:deoxyribonuclease IV [Verrucomicrobiota bacterium]
MPHKLLIGAHTSAAGGAPHALYEGKEIGATTIQFFTNNQRQWRGRTIEKEEIVAWEAALEETGIEKPMSHASYLINLGSPDPELLHKSRAAFGEEIERCHHFRLAFLNVHPGVATQGNEEECLERIAESLLHWEKLLAKGETRILLETTAGQGKCVGYSFEQLGFLVEKVKKHVQVGVCIDTCHIFAAGYDIRTEEGWKKTLAAFEKEVGLEHLYAFHCNDSEKELGSRVDRHASLGKGKIGLESFRVLMTHPQTALLPKYLETPEGPIRWKEEIALLRKFVSKQ